MRYVVLKQEKGKKSAEFVEGFEDKEAAMQCLRRAGWSNEIYFLAETSVIAQRDVKHYTAAEWF